MNICATASGLNRIIWVISQWWWSKVVAVSVPMIFTHACLKERVVFLVGPVNDMTANLGGGSIIVSRS
jgi:hypothetical protein